MNKRILTFLSIGLLTLTACAVESSSLSSATTSDSASSSVTSSAPSPYQEIVISRETWPLLTFSPFVPTRAFFNNLQFKYMGANNNTENVIIADSSSFFLYNVNPLLNVERIVINKALIKNRINFKVYGANMVIDDADNSNITEQEIPAKMESALVYSYDFTPYEFSYFRITNGTFPLTIQSIQIFVSKSFQFPTSINQGNTEILPDTGEGYYQLTEPAITRDDFKFMTGSALEGAALPHVGNPKVLVVPIMFTDYACDGGVLDCAKITSDINKAFFGTSEDTAYESVRSYYYKSSYGKLTIDGTVTPIYEVGKSTVDWAREVRTGREYDEFYHPAWGLTEDVVAWYKTLTETNLSDYDANGDGWIDAVYLLYLSPAYPRFYPTTQVYPEDVEDVFWAYVYWNYNNVSLADETNPVPFTFSFLGYDFMYEGYGDKAIDAITYIHESGHILGLTDYYSYDTDLAAWGPTGGLDMMDNNILDHNAYSKFLLEWIDPYVIDNTKQSTTITLEPFATSGDAVIVKNEFNDSPYDNYLILEYYTPTGLNEEHALAPYGGNSLQGFTEAGVKIYHVDSRIGAYDWDTADFLNFTDEVIIPEDENYTEYYMIVNSNSVTRHRGEMTYMKLIHLLEASGENTFRKGFRASNDTLFQVGDSFTPLKHFAAMTLFGQFNDGTEIGYEITIDAMDASGVTITFTRWSF